MWLLLLVESNNFFLLLQTFCNYFLLFLFAQLQLLNSFRDPQIHISQTAAATVFHR